jgi:hypothetical protein
MPAKPNSKPEEILRIRIVESAWHLSETGNYLVVTTTIRNESTVAVRFSEIKVLFKDQNNALLKSESYTTGVLKAGESTTFELSTRSDARIHHYNMEAEAIVDDSFTRRQVRVLKPFE